MPEPFVGLAESIQALRKELAAAEQGGSESDIRFRLKPVKLTVQTVLRREADVGGKIRWWLIEAGAEGKRGSESMQTLELELEPLRLTSGELTSLEVASDTAEGEE